MAEAQPRLRTLLRQLQENRDLIPVLAIISVLVGLIAPLPASIMDFLLTANITLAVVIMVSTLYVTEPLEISAFPAILLVTTTFRLALNVATTRLIIGRAGEVGDEAAGIVVKSFGTFVAADNLVVGIVVFVIIVIVQFVVITKGATRVSEVAARFQLDGMPGKQMAIDADLNAGLINEQQARERRERIVREADFYGAMDGAGKFVRGDAIAGILITLVNIVGGLIVGMAMFGMAVGEAANVFTTLTIGDGLVSQIPSLLTSLATGLIVTRAGGEGRLGSELMTQLFRIPRALYIAAGFLLVLFITPLPKIPLGGIALSCAGIAWVLQWKAKDEAQRMRVEKEKEVSRKPERVEAYLPVDPMELEVGYALIRIVDATQGGDLLDRITMLRRQTASDLGLIVPPIRIRDNMQLRPNDYIMKIKGVSIARGSVFPEQYLAMDGGMASGKIEGVETTEPAFGLPAVWISEGQKGRAEAMGYTVVTPSSVIATHLTEIIRGHAEEILSREDVERLLHTLRESAPKLVAEVVPEMVKPAELRRILRGLLKERVSIRDLETILQALAEFAPRTKDFEVLVEYCRNALGRGICEPYLDPEGRVQCIVLDPRMEDLVRGATERTEGGSHLNLAPPVQRRIVERVSASLEGLVGAGHHAVVVCSPVVRLQVKRLLDPHIPQVVVLSYNEIPRGVRLESTAVVTLE